MKVIVFCHLILLFLFFGCSPKINSPQTFPGMQVSYGSGGGITGSVQSHTLLENRQLFAHNSLHAQTQFLKRIEAKTCSEIFEQLESLSLQDSLINHPGNIYHFIEVKKAHSVHRISWGAADYAVPADIQHLFNRLMSL